MILPIAGGPRVAVTERTLNPVTQREAARALLGELCGPQATYTHGEQGQPLLQGAPGVVTVSHCRSGAAVAWSLEGPIGIDIESHGRDRQMERVAPRFRHPADSPGLTLLQLWTAKEAAYKAWLTPGLPLTAIRIARQPGSAVASAPGLPDLAVAWHPLQASLLCLATGLREPR